MKSFLNKLPIFFIFGGHVGLAVLSFLQPESKLPNFSIIFCGIEWVLTLAFLVTGVKYLTTPFTRVSYMTDKGAKAMMDSVAAQPPMTMWMTWIVGSALMAFIYMGWWGSVIACLFTLITYVVAYSIAKVERPKIEQVVSDVKLMEAVKRAVKDTNPNSLRYTHTGDII